VDFPNRDERSEVACILRHQDEVAVQASGQHPMIRRAQHTEVAWMLYNVNALRIQRTCDSRGQALIQKQPHRSGPIATRAQLRQGLPDGRPRSG